MYLDLETACRTPFHENVGSGKLTGFTKDLVDEAHKQNYELYRTYGNEPRIVVFGITHSQGDNIDQMDRILNILRPFFNNDDALLLEGAGGPCEIVLSNTKEPHLNRLIAGLEGRLKRIIINENFLSWARNLVDLQSKQSAEKEYGKDSFEMHEDGIEQATCAWFNSFQKRDEDFCLHPIVGLVPLVKNTSATYEPVKGRLWQLVGLMHLHAGNLERMLKANNASFLMLLPKEGYVPSTDDKST